MFDGFDEGFEVLGGGFDVGGDGGDDGADDFVAVAVGEVLEGVVGGYEEAALGGQGVGLFLDPGVEVVELLVVGVGVVAVETLVSGVEGG